MRPPGHDLPDTHEFVRLSEGLCHYRIDGPLDGKTLLLVHGATVPGWAFDRLVPYFTAAGFRTLRPDLYGHGYSDRPRVRYTHALFVHQLAELLAALGIERPVHVLGHSLGAALGARLVCRYPELFVSLVLAAPLVDFTVHTPSAKLLGVPLLGECLMPIYVKPMLVRRRRRRYRAIEDGRFVGKFNDQLRKPGFGRALLSMFRSGSLGDQSDCYEALARERHPVLVLRGMDDPIVSSAQVDAINRRVTRARVVEVAETAHTLILTDPDKVAPLAIGFFAGIGSPAAPPGDAARLVVTPGR